VISINRAYAFSETALGKSGLFGAAMAQFVGFRFQFLTACCQKNATKGLVHREAEIGFKNL
jgi:hypothetical protein